MNFTEYKKQKLEEVFEYSNKLYDNYKEQTDSTNKNILTLSYTAIFAIFIFLYKVKIEENTLILIKISIGMLFLTLTCLITLSIVYAWDSSSKEKKYKEIYNKLLTEDKETIFRKRITDSNKEMVNSSFYTIMFVINMFSYLLFLLAYGIFAYIIIFEFKVLSC
jgi:hypothetical protein